MHGRIHQDIGFNGTYYICLKILQVHYNAPPNTNDYTTVYLRQLRRAPNINEPPQVIVPPKIFQEGWSKMKEHTSPGISGLHFGHLKASSQPPLISDFEAYFFHTPIVQFQES